jgi:hypothetical protein
MAAAMLCLISLLIFGQNPGEIKIVPSAARPPIQATLYIDPC